MQIKLIRSMSIIFLSVCLLFSFSSLGIAQNLKLKFERLTHDQGLSPSIVNCIFQDSKGFMWFGTNAGLSKYDGYRFTTYKHDSNNPKSLSRNEIRAIVEDTSGALWIGTYGGGLARFNRETDSFNTFRHRENDPYSLSDDYVLSLLVDPYNKNVLWIGTEGGGLNRLILSTDSTTIEQHSETTKFTHWRHGPENPDSVRSNAIACIYADQSDVLWLGPEGGGLVRFDPQTETFKHWIHDPRNPNSLSNDWINAICANRSSEDSANIYRKVLWLGTHGGGLNRFDLQKETFTHWLNESDNPLSLSNNYLNSLYVDNSGLLWIATDGGGLNCFNPETAIFTQWLTEPGKPSSLSDNEVTTIFEDRAGVLWIGTSGGGVCKVGRNRGAENRFLHWLYVTGDSSSLSNNDVRAIYEDESGAIWIGTYGGGLNQFDRETGKFKHWISQRGDIEGLGIDIYYPQVNNIIAIFEDSYKILWLGTYGGKFLQFDRKTKKFVPWPYAYGIHTVFGKGLNQKYVLSFFEDTTDSSSVLWIGTHAGGLNQMIWDGKKKVMFNHFVHEAGKREGLNNNDVRCFYEDQAGRLWLGTGGGGINLFNRETGTVTHWINNPDDSTSLSNNFVQCIFEDNSETIWVGTEGGLNRFDPKTRRFNRYTEKDGLPNDNICGILEDASGNLWLSTKKGVSKFNPKSKTFRNYDVYDGLQSNEFNRGAFFNSRNGEMFFGGVNGFNSFYPDSIEDNPTIPPVVITDFQIANKTIKISPDGSTPLIKHISETDEIVLSYKDDVFSFEFAALDYNSPEKNEYAYKMEGFDEDWYYSETRRFATYTNLDPGKYIFRVKASNNDGVWNETGTAIKIIITPPFWQTWWFQILLFAAIAGTIILFHNYRISRRLELERIRTRLASDLHDDIGSTLTKIAVHSEIIQTTNENSKILSSAKKIGEMSREIVTTMSDIVWSIDSRNDTIGDLLDRMRDFAMNTLSPKQIKVTFQSDGLDCAKILPAGIRQNLYLIFKETINNIARHSSAKNVHIHLNNKGSEFYLTISDDGKGFDESKIRVGNGLKNMRMRAKRLRADLVISHQDETKVILKMKAV
ncbi:MAG: two-component regulator propeller domain-containing protein [bacterium]